MTRIVLIACLFGALQGAAWVVDGYHVLGLTGTAKGGQVDERDSLKLGEVLLVGFLTVANAVAPDTISVVERETREQIRNGWILLGAAVVLAGASLRLSRPRRR